LFLFSHPDAKPVVLLYARGLYHANLTLRSAWSKCDLYHWFRVVTGGVCVTSITFVSVLRLVLPGFWPGWQVVC